MLYVLSLKKSICRFVFLLIFSIFLNSAYSSDKVLGKYDKWKIAVNTPENSIKVFSFFYNNPHWPLFEESVKIAEKNISSNISDSIILKWFKRYHPKTSEGLSAYINRLMKTDPDFAKTYIKQTWIFQNLAPQFMSEYKSEFEDYVSSIDDAKKAKKLIQNIKIDQLKALKGIVVDDISQYISAFLKKHFSSKSGGYSSVDLKDIDKKYNIIQNLIDQKKDKKAADILSISNLNEEKYATSFFNQRRHIAYNVLRAGNPKLAYKVMKMYKLNSKNDEKIAKAEWLLGYLSFRFLCDNKKAISHFKKAYKNSTNSIRLSKNAFWLAEVYNQQKDVIFALNWYKKANKYFSTFYGYLAESRLKKLSKNHFSIIEDKSFENEKIFDLKDASFIFYNRELVNVLLKTKNKDMRKYFYQQLIDEIEDPNEEMLLMDIASANDEIDILISKNSKRQHYFSNQKAYKILEKSDMKHVSKVNSDPCFVSLVHSIIQRESNFNKNAKSHVGAIGLMQVMPSTAKYESKRLKFHVGNVSLFNKQKNITIGASILNRLLKKYKGNMIYTAAAYNCGEGGLAKYRKSIRNLENLTPLDIMELVPIKETRIYVKHVIRAMFTYQKKFFTNSCYNCDLILNWKK